VYKNMATDLDLNEFEDFTNFEKKDFDKIYKESFKNYEENSIIKATVIEVSSDTVFLDFGHKSEAKIPLSEFGNKPKIGDEVTVFLVRLEGRNGDPIVSKQKADAILDRKELLNIIKEKEIVEGIVSDVSNKGGVIVKYKSLVGLIPYSIFDTQELSNYTKFLNQKIKFYVEKLKIKDESSKSSKRSNAIEVDFIGNRKRYLLEESNIQRKEFLEKIKQGDILEGTVKTITNYGAFVDIGNGVEALLHIKDISWLRVNNVNDFLKVGEKITVQVLGVEKEKGKISIGLKQLQEEPWSKFIKQFKENDVIKGKVVSITTYGVFVNIIDGVDGLLHISDISWTKNIKNPGEMFKKGDIVEVKIIKIDKVQKRVNLSLKHLLENPWDKVKDKYKEGTKVKGKITNIVSFGLFVELEEGIEALLHLDDISWTEKIKNLNTLYKVGEEIECVVISNDYKKGKIRVSVKHLTEDPWKVIREKFKNGDIIEVEIVKIDETKGLEVKVIDNLIANIPISQIGFGRIDEIRKDLKDNFKIGDKIKVLIIELDAKKRNIKLSIKEYIKKEEKKKVEAFIHKNNKEDTTYTIEDMIKSKKQE